MHDSVAPDDVIEAALAAWANPCRVHVVEKFSLEWVYAELGPEALACLLGPKPKLRVTVCHGEPPRWCHGGICVCPGGEPYEERKLCSRRCVETRFGYVLVEEV